jgi:hypothetical protein
MTSNDFTYWVPCFCGHMSEDHYLAKDHRETLRGCYLCRTTMNPAEQKGCKLSHEEVLDMGTKDPDLPPLHELTEEDWKTLKLVFNA